VRHYSRGKHVLEQLETHHLSLIVKVLKILNIQESTGM
jgi:hypothetical protein